jgi:hypothetical protein
MTVDLLKDQSIKVLLPDGSHLVLSHYSQVTRLEHWTGGALISLLSLPTPHDRPEPPNLYQQTHHNRPSPTAVYPTSNTL